MSDNLLPKLLTPREAAEMLACAASTLAVWRCTRRYDLPWILVGRAVRYRREDLLAFIERRTQQPATPAA
jgi:hypothetical protein